MLINLRSNNFQFFSIGLIIFSLLLTSCNDDEKYKKTVIAELDGEKLLVDDFAKRLSREIKNYDILIAKDPVFLGQAKERVLKNFILETLSTKWAKSSNITITEEEVLLEMNHIRSQYPNDTTLRKNLIDERLSLQELKQKTRHSLLQKKIAAELIKGISQPSEEEIKNYYNTNKEDLKKPDLVRIQQVVTEREDSAQKIYKSIKKGKSISELAKEFSIAPEGANGGDTGWISPKTLDIFQQAHRMPLHSISKVTKSPFGFHVFKVIGKSKSRTLKYTEAKESIRQKLLELRQQASYSAWLDDQLKKYRYYKNHKALAAVVVSASE